MWKKVALGIGLAGTAAVVARSRTGGNGTEEYRPSHQSETQAAYENAKTRILVLGANFGGLAAALSLDKRLGKRPGTSILLVDRNNSQLFTPLLWLVAEGRVALGDVTVPVRDFQRGRSFHVLLADVEKIDLDNRKVFTTAGPRTYDYLVIALGSTTAVPNLPGLREHILTFHSTLDALELHNHLIDAVEKAHQSEDPDDRRAWLTFVVGGAGDTGVELAAAIHDYIQDGLFAEYPWLANEKVRIVLVGRPDRVVPMSTPQTSDAVRKELEVAGIEVKTGVSITGADDGAVHTSEGDIPSHTLFWAAGISAPRQVKELNVDKAHNGAVKVDDHLRVPGHPEVFVVGDAAWAYDAQTKDAIPPTAQAAEHEGAYVGQAIAAELEGRKVRPFSFKPIGHLALLGARTGVAQVGSFMFTGLPAWLFWHAYYMYRIPSWRDRIYLLIHFALTAILGPDTKQMRLRGHEGEGGLTKEQKEDMLASQAI